jgi:hypothetical protein
MASRLQEYHALDNMLALICHPETPAHAVRGIECRIELQENGRLWIRYHVEAPLNDLVLADEAEPKRTDGLWETTCFEAFLIPGFGPQYFELNFSPSSQWAAYSFLDMGDDYFALEAIVELPNTANWLGVSASLSVVLEETEGTKSYWALSHPIGSPDFHHRDCFTLELLARSGL